MSALLVRCDEWHLTLSGVDKAPAAPIAGLVGKGISQM
jgi:hypothetical protein